jgi:hypothetical protein
MGSDAVSLGEYFPTFRKLVILFGLLDRENEGPTIFQKGQNNSTNKIISHTGRNES